MPSACVLSAPRPVHDLSGWRRDFLSNRKYRYRPHTQPDVGNCWPCPGFRDKEKAWFKSYLFDRSICIRVECAQLQPQPISSGVLQVSVLGPQLFVIFLRVFPILSLVAALFLPMTL